MICKSCERNIPDDSTFCQYCRHEVKESHSKNDEILNEIQDIKSDNNLKEDYSKQANKDKKEIEKLQTKNEGLLVGIVLLIIILCALLAIFYNDNTQKNDEISSLEKSRSEWEGKASKYYNKYQKILHKANFLDEYVALVNEDSNEYHTLDCEYFDTSYFWAYNIEAAEDNGYIACPKCH